MPAYRPIRRFPQRLGRFARIGPAARTQDLDV